MSYDLYLLIYAIGQRCNSRHLSILLNLIQVPMEMIACWRCNIVCFVDFFSMSMMYFVAFDFVMLYLTFTI